MNMFTMFKGSGAFNIIHPMLYQKCIDILKLWISQKGKTSLSFAIVLVNCMTL